MSEYQIEKYNSWRWGTLLTLLIVAFSVAPVFGSSDLMELVGFALFEVSLVGAVFATTEQKNVRVAICIAAVIWIVAILLGLQNSLFSGYVTLLSVTVVISALALTFSHLLKNRDHDLNHLFGAIFGYFLLAMAWAMLYTQIERWQPGSFEVGLEQELWSSFVYFSLVTVTTLGYGDILPISPLARLCTAFEAAIGVLYIAVMVGSIVGRFRNSVAMENSSNGKT